jgi:hypothetical protein
MDVLLGVPNARQIEAAPRRKVKAEPERSAGALVDVTRGNATR